MSKVRPERAPGSTNQKIDESTYQDEWKLYNPFAKTIQRKSYGLLIFTGYFRKYDTLFHVKTCQNRRYFCDFELKNKFWPRKSQFLCCKRGHWGWTKTEKRNGYHIRFFAYWRNDFRSEIFDTKVSHYRMCLIWLWNRFTVRITIECNTLPCSFQYYVTKCYTPI